jgi:hypothetical protein
MYEERFVSNFDPAELTQEKNLYQVFLGSRKLHSSRLNQIVTGVACLVFGCLFLVCWQGGIASRHEFGKAVIDIARFGFSFTLSMLGFLLAGFTVFATLGKIDLLMMMAKTPYNGQGELSYLKYTFFMFMRVMIFYFLGACCFAVVALVGPFASRCLSRVAEVTSGWVIAGIIFTFMGSLVFYLLSILQSFIFNIYHMLMTSIRWEFEKPTKKTEQASSVTGVGPQDSQVHK